MKMITRTTGARVSCSKEKTQGPGAKGNVSITGFREEVKHAKVRRNPTHAQASYLGRLLDSLSSVLFMQELILEKVREDVTVRTKISQSSALRQKRGHTATQKPGNPEPEAPVGLNNNGPYTPTEKNGLVYPNGPTAEPGNTRDKTEELKTSNTDNEEEEESTSTDSVSGVSKFES